MWNQVCVDSHVIFMVVLKFDARLMYARMIGLAGFYVRWDFNFRITYSIKGNIRQISSYTWLFAKNTG